MKILQLCAKPPRPLVDGGCIAMNAITVGLTSTGHEVHTIAIKTDKHPGDEKKAAELRREIASYEEVYVDTRLKPIGALVSLVHGQSYNIARFESEALKQAIRSKAEEEDFDIVILESLFMMPNLSTIRKYSNAKVVLRAHNVEHKIWEGIAEDENSGLRGWYLNVLAKQLKAYEIEHLNNVDAIIPITDEDKAVFKDLGSIKPMFVSPYGMEFKDSNTQPKVDHVVHFGSMDWKPNQDGVRWLMNEVWPKVRKEKPDVKLLIAGRHIPSNFESKLAEGIEVIGEVHDAWEFLQRPAIITIPIHSGSGMRIKGIEGMAAGRPLVSTSLGAAGLGITHAKTGYIANTSEEFASAIITLLNDEGNVGNDGSHYIRKKFSLLSISEQLSTFLTSL